jgi:hypothetical protein
MNSIPMKGFRLFILLASVIILTSQEPASAQCAMCKASVESNIENGGKTVGRGLNTGILYLMSIPYLVLGGIGFMVYKNWKGKTA